jgi:hypothetical protein
MNIVSETENTHTEYSSIDDSSYATHETIQEISVEELEIKEIEPEEMFEHLSGWSTNEEEILESLKNVKVKEDLSIPHSDNPLEMVIPPGEMFYFADEEESSEDSNADDSSSVSTRSSRADAGGDFTSATKLVEGGNWTGDYVDSHFSSSSNSWVIDDYDFFYINVEEKGNLETELVEFTIFNGGTPSNDSSRLLVCFIFDPVSLLLHQNTNMLPGDYVGKTISKTDSDIGITYLDLAIIDAQETQVLRAAPPVSGVLFIEMYCISNPQINYTINPIEKTVIKPVTNPYDKNNYPHNATVPQTKTGITGSLLQHKDHWDWYDISGFLDYVGDKWPNEISYDIDITRTNSQQNSYHTWTSVWLVYDSLDGNTLYIYGDEIDTGGSDTINLGGVPTVPIKDKIERYAGNIWLGIRSYAIAIDQNQMYPSPYDGGCDYTITSFGINVKNQAPLLTQGKLEPTVDYFFMEDEITFKVKYRDYENDAPEYVRVTIDGDNYEMTGSGSNYESGVVYSFSILGSELDDNFYPHTFNFSTDDGLFSDILVLSSPKNEFKVIEDQTPTIADNAPVKLRFDEDQHLSENPYILQFSKIFVDKDPQDGLSYSLWDGDSYGNVFNPPVMDVFVIEKTKLKIQLKPNQHGGNEIQVKATEILKRNLDTYEFYATYKFNITVSSIQDSPVLNPIDKIYAKQDVPIFFTITATDPDLYTDDDELEFSTNVSDGKGSDDLEGFKVIHDPINNTMANISFTPDNQDVGIIYVEISVTDSDKNEDTRDIIIDVANENDPPVFKQVEKDYLKKDVTDASVVEMTAPEDDWFNVTLDVQDEDIRIGLKNDITFNIENHTFVNVVDIDFAGGTSLTATLSIYPLNSDVGTQYINVSVHDGKGGEDKLTFKLNVENVNDPPDVPEITKPEERTFSITDSIMFVGISDDEDFDIPKYIYNENHTYKWYLKEGETYTEIRNTEPFDRVRIAFPSPYLPYNDKEIKAGNYTVKLEVIDLSGESRFTEISIRLLDDYDNDNILDAWELNFDLDPKDRNDAFMDSDSDGFSNLKEFEVNTNPRDPNSKPYSEESGGEDYTMIIVIVIVVVVIVVLLVLFLLMRNRRKEQELLDDIDNLAYPDEDSSDLSLDTLKTTVGPAPGQGPIGGPMGSGMGQMPPPPPPGVSPAVHMQIMKMMKSQQQAQGQQPGQPGVGMGGAGTKPTSPHLGTGPGTGLQTGTGKGNEFAGQQLPPAQLSGSQSGTQQNFSGDTSTSGTANIYNSNANGMKCPNCGIAVQSGWFLCPACKSPLN